MAIVLTRRSRATRRNRSTAAAVRAAAGSSTRAGRHASSREGFAAQARHEEISGVERSHFCGAYWGYGFHEDGVRSAVRVAEGLGATL